MFQLMVDGMSCGHCIKSITEAVKKLDGNAEASVSLDEKKVTVETNKATRESIEQAIIDSGYDIIK